MKRKKADPESSSTRRTFLKSAGGVAAGGAIAGQLRAQGSVERLAMLGGPKTVSYPADRHREVQKWPLYGAAEERAVVDVLRNPSYAPVDAFENDWKDYCDAPFVKAHYNGTSALAAMFFALDLPPGSEILVPTYTFFATITPMRFFDLTPVFVDVNPHTLNLDVEDAKRRLTKNTKAILPVHWVGLPCDMDAISDFANKRGLILLEDAAHAHGARLNGKHMGTFGRMAIFSFQMSKLLPAIEGGMGLYQNRGDYERAAILGHYTFARRFPESSRYRRYEGTGLGLKFRMHPLGAALARAQLRTLDKRNAVINGQIRTLNDQLKELPGLIEPPQPPGAERVYYARNLLFLDEAKAGMSRKAVVKALRAEGVRASEHSYRLQHTCAIYHEANWWDHKPVIPDLPGAEEANRTAINVPPCTSEAPELIDQYARAFKKVWAHRSELASV